METNKIIEGDCIEVMKSMSENSVDAIVTDPPYLLEFMSKRWDKVNTIEPSFGFWLAGLVDGEGCFRIHRVRNGDYYECHFQLKLRSDDKKILQEIQRTLGFGRIQDNKSEGNSKPTSSFIINSRGDCFKLANLFLLFQLKAKKQIEFFKWYEALLNWDKQKKGSRWKGKPDVSAMETNWLEMKELRNYNENKIPVNKNAFFHYLWAKECLRVLKPGGYLLSMGGTRTYHRMTQGIEDAGFEIRDCIMYLYGSGFPKSLDISKAIDKMGAKDTSWFIEYALKVCKERGIPKSELSRLFLSKNSKPTRWIYNKVHTQPLTIEQFNKIKDFLDLPFKDIQEAEREIIGKGKAGLTKGNICKFSGETEFDITSPSTPEAQQWNGWGTALKPACEPIVVARKPLSEKSVALNVLKWGTGGINIDGGRIGYENTQDPATNPLYRKQAGYKNKNAPDTGSSSYSLKNGEGERNPNNKGRFPANIILDEESAKALDQQSGELKSGDNCRRTKEGYFGEHGGLGKAGDVQTTYGDSGGASRYFKIIKVYKDGFSIYNICGNTSGNQRIDGMLNGVIEEVEKYTQGVERFLCGNNKMESFQKDMKSIILTLTRQMTELKTLNVCQEESINYYMEESEKTIKLLKELNIENARDAKNINHLITFKNVVLELIRDIVRNVKKKILENGEQKTGNTGTNITGNTENANRFFYVAKASRAERNAGLKGFKEKPIPINEPHNSKNLKERYEMKASNNHPTVKPIQLMRYLVRLVCPPKGLVLDPFIGSGTTGIACLKEGFKFMGIENEPDYVKIARARINHVPKRLDKFVKV